MIGLRSKHIYPLQSNTTVFGSFAYLYLFLIMLKMKPSYPGNSFVIILSYIYYLQPYYKQHSF